VKRTWYHVALARPADAPVLVAASGEHMGQAIAEAQAQVAGSWPIAVEHASEDKIPLGESVGKGHVVMLGDAAPETPTFRWPVGVLPSVAGAKAVVGAGPGWTVRPQKLLVIEAQTDAENLTDLFMGMIERLPSGDNLEVRVLDHFEDAATTDVWLTSRITAKKIIRFLDDHDEELFGNGHLELSIYVRAHKATLRLTEHKTVVWLAEEGALHSEVEGWLGELKLPHVPDLVTVSRGPHFHYRPAKSRDRKKLGEELFRQRLRKVDSLKKSARA
jgi:hypothetical protein